MSYEIKMSDHTDGRTKLSVIIDGAEAASHVDGGEPEDSYFYRDWSWVSDELERAYQQGLKDGAK